MKQGDTLISRSRPVMTRKGVIYEPVKDKPKKKAKARTRRATSERA